MLSTWDRRGTREASGGHLGTGARPLSALALLAVTGALAAVSVTVAAVGEGSGVAAAPSSGAPPRGPGPVVAPALYRLVGCRSTGATALHQGPPRREVAIGFDDGPWTLTPAFVRMLERNRARATFFMIGRQVSSAERSLLLRELRDGDVLGDHSFSHADLTRSADARRQLLSTIGAIRMASGYTPCVFRPPYGSYDPRVLKVARSLGLSTILWNVDPADYAQPGTMAIEQRVLAQVRPGSIIISHDGGGSRAQTLAAYPAIISALRSRGYEIVTIPEMFGYRPLYAPCVRPCAGLGEPRRMLPRNAIIKRAP